MIQESYDQTRQKQVKDVSDSSVAKERNYRDLLERASFKLGYKVVHILISEQESLFVLQILSFIDINGALA